MRQNTHYIAIIGDIVGSRAREDRDTLQDRLLAACAELNEDTNFVAPLRMTSGDGFEALATTEWSFTPMLVAMEAAAWPSLVSFGLGFGELSTAVPGNTSKPDVGALDGPAFHRARLAIERASEQTAWFAAEGFEAPVNALLCATGELLGITRRRWTDRQRELVVSATRHRGTRKALAAAFGISPSVVTETLGSAEFDAFARATALMDVCWPLLGDSSNPPNSGQNSAK